MKKTLAIMAGTVVVFLLVALFRDAATTAEAQTTTNKPQIRDLSGTVYPPGLLTNFLIVSKAGNDLSGRRGNAALPFATITAAKTNAAAGDTIIVYPGTYAENNLLKAGVNYSFYPGTFLTHTSTTTNVADGWGFFDDRKTGPTTNIITGSVSFYFNGGTNYDALAECTGNPICVGAFVVTNALSNISFEFDTAKGDEWDDCGPYNDPIGLTAIFCVTHCQRVILKGNELLSPNKDLFSPPTATETVTGNPGSMIGIYWGEGPMFVNIKHIGPFINNGTWCAEPAGAHATDFFLVSDFSEGYNYFTSHTATYRAWYTFGECSVTNLGILGMIGSAGRAYIQGMKLASTLNNSGGILAASSGAEMWVSAEKLTAGSSRWFFDVDNTAGSTIHATVQHYEGGTTNVGFINNGGLLEINGGEMAINGIGGIHAGGRTILKGMGICTTNSNQAKNFPLMVTGAGLSVQNCRLVGPALCLTNIFATSGQTVGIYNVASSVTNAAIITARPGSNYLFSVDAALR